MTSYGYIRVSSREQKTDRQEIAMRQAGIPERRVFIDKISGKNFDRPEYHRMVKKLRPGDTLYVKSIDRLGRNYDEIQEQWRFLTKEIRCDIVVMDMPLLDTREGKDRTGVFIADLVLQILSYVAETEREYIHSRQAEGIAAAKARGVKFGPKTMKKPDSFPEVYSLWVEKKISARGAARQLGVSCKTFQKWANNVDC